MRHTMLNMKHASWHEMCYGISSLYSFVPGLGSPVPHLRLDSLLCRRWCRCCQSSPKTTSRSTRSSMSGGHRYRSRTANPTYLVHTLLLLLHHSRSPRPPRPPPAVAVTLERARVLTARSSAASLRCTRYRRGRPIGQDSRRYAARAVRSLCELQRVRLGLSPDPARLWPALFAMRIG